MIFLGLACLFLPPLWSADNVEPKGSVPKLLDAYVTDLAQLLPAAHKARLRQALFLLHRDEGKYCSLLTVESLSRYGWTRKQADLFAKRAFKKGCVDSNGLLIVVAKKEKIARVRFGKDVKTAKGRAVKRVMMVDYPLDAAKTNAGNALVRAVEKSIETLAPSQLLTFHQLAALIAAMVVILLLLMSMKGWQRVLYLTASLVGIPVFCVSAALLCVHYEWYSGVYFCLFIFIITYEYIRFKVKERRHFPSTIEIPFFILRLLTGRRRPWC